MNSERLYRKLLTLYPEPYRRRYAEPMALCFRDQLRAADTPGKRAGLWLCTLADLLRTVPARHLERLVPQHGVHRLTEPGRRAIFFARAEASSFARREITLEHLLLGILREDRTLGFSPSALEGICKAIESVEPHGRRIPPDEDLPLSSGCRRVLAAAARSGAPPIGTRQLLEAIRRQERTLAARLLRDLMP